MRSRKRDACRLCWSRQRSSRAFTRRSVPAARVRGSRTERRCKSGAVHPRPGGSSCPVRNGTAAFAGGPAPETYPQYRKETRGSLRERGAEAQLTRAVAFARPTGARTTRSDSRPPTRRAASLARPCSNTPDRLDREYGLVLAAPADAGHCAYWSMERPRISRTSTGDVIRPVPGRCASRFESSLPAIQHLQPRHARASAQRKCHQRSCVSSRP
jgi:hypothetical protein